MTATALDLGARSKPAGVDEYSSYVSMHHTDAAAVVYVGSPNQWAQVGMENLFRAAGHPLESLHGQPVHYPMVRQDINHRSKLRLGDPVTVRTWIDRVGNRSFTVATTISKSDGTVAVTVEFTAVAVGRDGSKPPVDDWLRQLHEDAKSSGFSLTTTSEATS